MLESKDESDNLTFIKATEDHDRLVKDRNRISDLRAQLVIFNKISKHLFVIYNKLLIETFLHECVTEIYFNLKIVVFEKKNKKKNYFN